MDIWVVVYIDFHIQAEMVLYQKEGVRWDQAWDLKADEDFEIK